MNAQIFLIAPADAQPAPFSARLQALLAAREVPVLLVPRAGRSDADYRALLKAVLPVAQPANCAVLVENDIALARAVGADGVHIAGSEGDLAEAIDSLKPDMIVGVGGIATRHAAMSVGEMDIDYLFFGPLAGEPISEPVRELALWWSQAMQVPSVYSDPVSGPETLDAGNCEFVALGEQVWSFPGGPEQALAAYAGQPEEA